MYQRVREGKGLSHTQKWGPPTAQKPRALWAEPHGGGPSGIVWGWNSRLLRSWCAGQATHALTALLTPGSPQSGRCTLLSLLLLPLWALGREWGAHTSPQCGVRGQGVLEPL